MYERKLTNCQTPEIQSRAKSSDIALEGHVPRGDGHPVTKQLASGEEAQTRDNLSPSSAEHFLVNPIMLKARAVLLHDETRSQHFNVSVSKLTKKRTFKGTLPAQGPASRVAPLSER